MKITQKLVKKSFVRAIDLGNKVEVFFYEKPFFYNFEPFNIIGSVKKNDKRREDSILRTQLKIRRLVDCNVSDNFVPKFITLTFKENVEDYNKAIEYWKLFSRRLRIRFKGIKYICVVEFQERGAVHFHLLLFNVNYVRNFKDWIRWNWKWGFSDLRGLSNIKWIGLYVSKYFTKASMDNRLAGVKGYFTSKNLQQPVIYREKENVEKFIAICKDWSIIKDDTFDSKERGLTKHIIYASNN